MNPEDLVDWSAVPGPREYCSENVSKAIAGIRKGNPKSPDILFQIANNHGGELYPAAVVAVPILLDIALKSGNFKAAIDSLAIIDTLVWFRATPAFLTVVQDGEEVTLENAIRVQVEASRAQLQSLANRDHRMSPIVHSLLESIDEQEKK